MNNMNQFNANQVNNNYHQNPQHPSTILTQQSFQNPSRKRNYHQALYPPIPTTYNPSFIAQSHPLKSPQITQNHLHQHVIVYNNNNSHISQDSSIPSKRRKIVVPTKQKKKQKISNPQHNRVTRSFKGSLWDPLYCGDDMRILPRKKIDNLGNKTFDYHLIYYIKPEKFGKLQNEKDFYGQSCSLSKSLNEIGYIDVTFYFANTKNKTYQASTTEYFIGICDDNQKDSAFGTDPYYWHPSIFPGSKKKPNNSWKSGIWGVFNDGVILNDKKLIEDVDYNPSLGKLEKSLKFRMQYNFEDNKQRNVTFKYVDKNTNEFIDIVPSDSDYTFKLSSGKLDKFFLFVSLYDRTDHVKVERFDNDNSTSDYESSSES